MFVTCSFLSCVLLTFLFITCFLHMSIYHLFVLTCLFMTCFVAQIFVSCFSFVFLLTILALYLPLCFYLYCFLLSTILLGFHYPIYWTLVFSHRLLIPLFCHFLNFPSDLFVGHLIYSSLASCITIKVFLVCWFRMEFNPKSQEKSPWRKQERQCSEIRRDGEVNMISVYSSLFLTCCMVITSFLLSLPVPHFLGT